MQLKRMFSENGVSYKKTPRSFSGNVFLVFLRKNSIREHLYF